MSNTPQGKAAMRLPLLCSALAVWLIVPAAVLASPPIPDDLSLRLQVVSTTDPTFAVGTHAVLSFDVAQHGPTPRVIAFAIYNVSEIPDGAAQPIRLVQNANSPCNFSTDTSGDVWLYIISSDLPPVGSSLECLVDIEVLPAASSGYMARFTVSVLDPEDGWDPEPRNSNVALVVGGSSGPAASVPIGTPALLILAAGLVATAARKKGAGGSDERRLGEWLKKRFSC